MNNCLDAALTQCLHEAGQALVDAGWTDSAKSDKRGTGPGPAARAIDTVRWRRWCTDAGPIARVLCMHAPAMSVQARSLTGDPNERFGAIGEAYVDATSEALVRHAQRVVGINHAPVRAALECRAIEAVREVRQALAQVCAEAIAKAKPRDVLERGCDRIAQARQRQHRLDGFGWRVSIAALDAVGHASDTEWAALLADRPWVTRGCVGLRRSLARLASLTPSARARSVVTVRGRGRLRGDLDSARLERWCGTWPFDDHDPPAAAIVAWTINGREPDGAPDALWAAGGACKMAALARDPETLAKRWGEAIDAYAATLSAKIDKAVLREAVDALTKDGAAHRDRSAARRALTEARARCGHIAGITLTDIAAETWIGTESGRTQWGRPGPGERQHLAAGSDQRLRPQAAHPLADPAAMITLLGTKKQGVEAPLERARVHAITRRWSALMIEAKGIASLVKITGLIPGRCEHGAGLGAQCEALAREHAKPIPEPQ